MLKIHDINSVLKSFIEQYPQLNWIIKESTEGGILDLEAINAVLHINNGAKIYLKVNTFCYCNISIVGSNIDMPFPYPQVTKEKFVQYIDFLLKWHGEFDQFCEDTLPF